MDDDLEQQYQQLVREVMALKATSPRQGLEQRLLRALVTFELDTFDRLRAQIEALRAMESAGIPPAPHGLGPMTIHEEWED